MTYDEAMEGEMVSAAEARREIENHDGDFSEFKRDCKAVNGEYCTSTILAWLGY